MIEVPALILPGQPPKDPPKIIIPDLILPVPEIQTAKIWTPDQGAPNVQRLINQPLSKQPAKIIKLWRERPIIFVTDLLDVVLDVWQEDFFRSYMEFERTAAVANKGPGKTATLAMLALHFMSCHVRPKAAALSITKDHLKDNLWAEILKWRSRSETLIRSLTDGSEKIARIGEEQYSFLSARSYPKEADESAMASALAGLHEDNCGFFIDEAGKIPDAVLATADAALSTEESKKGHGKKRIVVTANPEQPSGMIYRASLGRTVQKWNVIHVTGDPDDPKRSPRVTKEWAREQINTYGADHPWVLINVFGRYPKTSSDQLLSEHDIDESMKRVIPEELVAKAQLRLGVDVARGGADSSMFAPRRGLKAYPMEPVSSDVYGPELASRIMLRHREQRIERVYVDGTGGYGSSVYDSLTTHGSIDVTSVMYNGRAHDDKLYANKRTENWVRMRDWVRKGGQLPNDPILAAELMMPLLFFHGGRFQLESKDQIKKRLGRSPDRADALSQTFHDIEEFTQGFTPPQADPDRHLSDYEFMKKYKERELQLAGGNYLNDDSQLDTGYRPPSNYKS
jgi:phage terminase large subunit